MSTDETLYLNGSLVFLRVFDNGVYGYTFIISKTGTFIYALNEDGSKIIRYLKEEGLSLTEIQRRLKKSNTFSHKELETFIRQLIAKEILRYEKQGALPIWIDPSDVSTLQTKDAECFSIMFAGYLSNLFRDNASIIDSYKEFFPRLRNFFPAVSTSDRCLSLDIGCGSGHYSDALKEKIGPIISTDLSFERLLSFKYSPKRQEGTGNLVVVSDAERLPFRSNQFDLILCVFVLEHVMNPFKVVEEMSRIARAGAKFIIAFPSYSLVDTITTLFGRATPFLTFGHFHDFGFLSSRIPWCRNIKCLVKKIGNENIAIEHMEGIGLFGSGSNNFFIKKLSTLANKTIGKVFPFNRFGSQTVIIGRKK